MSIAVAVRKDGEIALAADTQTNFGDRRATLDNHRAAKMVQAGDAWIATTGWSLYDDILRDYLGSGGRVRLHDRTAIFRFFVRFWKDLRETYSLVNDESPPGEDRSPFADIDASFLVASPRGIFHVAPNLSVTEFERSIAIGSGADLAIGALHVLQDGEQEVAWMAERACRAAMAYDVYCGGDVDVVRVPEGRPKRAARSTARRPRVRAPRR